MIALLIVSLCTILLFVWIWFSSKKKEKVRLQSLQKRWGNARESYYNFELISLYKNIKPQKGLPEQTLNDLDFDEVFSAVDHTYSRVGQQFLYAHIQKEDVSAIWLQWFEKVVNSVSENITSRTELVKYLSKLDKTSDYYFPILFKNSAVKRIERMWLIRLIQTATLSSFVLLYFEPYFFFIFLLSITVSTGFHYWNKWQVDKYQHVIKRFGRFLNTAEGLIEENQRQNFFEENTKFVTSYNKLIKVRKNLRFISGTSSVGDESQQIVTLFTDFFNIVTLAEVSSFNKFFQRIESCKAEFLDVFEMIGTLDMAVSVASWRSSLKNYCMPVFIENEKLMNVENVVHPLVEGCVPNSLTLEDSSMLLTGSNMSGKTTFVRTIGLNVLFAQTLNTVLASKYEAPFMNIRTAIRFSDDITQSSSYYMTEVKQVKKLLDDSEQKPPVLFIIDELFKGTNTVERIAAAKAILTYLNHTNHFVLVSTHDIELTELLKKERYEMYYFQESIVENVHTFTYKLNAGIMTERNALRLLEINNYPKIVTDLAKETAKEISGNP